MEAQAAKDTIVVTQTERTMDPVEPAAPTAFDQARWPTNVALLLLAGLTGGLVVLAGGFDDPRLLHNAWVRLTTLGATLVALAVAANTLCPRHARRMQMAVLLSLVLHIGLAVFLHGQHLRRARQDAPIPSPTEVEELATPQYVEVTDPTATRPFEQPVAASVDEQVAQQVEVSRSDVTRAAPVEVLAATDPQADLPTATTRERDIARAAPHQSQTWSRLSRQTQQETVRSSPLELAQQDPQVPREEIQPLQPSSVETERSRSSPTVAQDVDTAPGATPPEAATEPARIPAEDQEPQLARSLAEIPRERALRALSAPTIAEDLPHTAQVAEEIPRQTLQAQTESPSRQVPREVVGSVVGSTDAAPETSVALPAADVERERPESPIRPEATVARVIEPNREPLPAEISPEASLAAAGTPPGQTPALEGERDLDPRATSVARTSSRSPSADPQAEPTDAVHESAATGPVAEVRRPRTSVEPDLDLPAAAAQPERIVQRADAVTAPADTSVAQVAATDGQATTSPARVDAAETKAGHVAPAPVVAAGAIDETAGAESPAVAATPLELRHRRAALAGAERFQPSGGSEAQRRSPADAARIADARADPRVARAAPRATSNVPRRERPAPSDTATVQRAAAIREPTSNAAPRTSAADDTGSDNEPVVAAAGSSRRTIGNAEPRQDVSLPRAPRSTATAGLPRIETSLADLPVATEMVAVGDDAAADVPTLRQDATSPIGRSERAIAVDIEEDVQEGGLAVAPAESSGSPDRRAQPQSRLVRIEPDRFLRPRAGGVAAIGGDTRAPAPAFVRRTRRQEEPARRAVGQPSPKTEAAIESGLVYLARHQMHDGRWSLAYNGVDLGQAPRERPQLQADTAATGLALLAFLGAGYDHYDDKYRDVVHRGLQFLLDNQKASGDLYLEENALSNRFNHFYSHGIAAIALSEAYGMTGDPALREPAQRAIDYIVASQHPVHGGWRYAPGTAAFSSDLSVSGWQVMALKSGELAGLDVPRKAYDEARRFLARCAVRGDGGRKYVYNPWATSGSATQQHGARPSTVMTAVGLLLDLYLGSNRQQAELRQGADHLLANLPTQGGEGSIPDIGTIGNPQRDTYYWYYATLVMFHMKGEYWQKWNDALHPLLVNSQSQTGRLAGSWNPYHPVRDQWAPQAGRLYVTAMNLLSLEVYYRHLPLYYETGR